MKFSKTFLKTLSLSLNLGFTIAIPLVTFAFMGRFLDKKWGTSPWFLLGGILLAIIMTTLLIYRKIKEIVKEE